MQYENYRQVFLMQVDCTIILHWKHTFLIHILWCVSITATLKFLLNEICIIIKTFFQSAEFLMHVIMEFILNII